ncbi:PLP-dependent aminotransferase family protein [Klebsiella pneumoniae]|uniref:aminotransferase-like domain-containing protein n=1 Tax=Klebsiella pneumoniae TaxID=573 RepID=UPI001FAD10B2|nr:PLP-dependent aminotransferase family protein [Klebsiella pneumoniae]MCI7928033.1 PLP-dependent aminotransferase family protein [Klebsiella pneumoniae]MCI7933168.1 PLP-dependent aminotransferase family protein [Klebsiella pneumoniae]HBT0123247.1 PLP-dependent aminotransferase family protein [Klebsiella pneumoniae]HBT0123908.1 PLP-dependent aminotransferase family protein [Klebsiella pneumoniae]HBT0151039.1 PLP-dependent aminotransferase family protein [Klebsiella pneumoniae]
MTRYQHLATLLAERIEQGLYRHGEKLPSVRSLSQEHGVSISTVQQAYQLLEQQQMIVPQPRSGYFVAPRKAQPPVPPMSRPVQRPVEITQWDIDGRVMLCSSFTKTIAPGLRIGWIAPGRYYDKLLQMKYAASGTNVPSTQLAACNFIREGHYHRHVRRMRQIYQRNIEIYTCWLREFFPCGICVTRPKGGFMLWVELPEQVDMVCVAKQLCRLKIQVAPGSLFSAAGKYRNCVRINCALPPTEKHKAVMVKLGEAVKVAME